MNYFTKRLAEYFDPTRLLRWLADVIPNILTALAIALAFVVLARVIGRAIDALRDRTKLDPTVVSFVRTGVRYTIMIVALLSILAEVGVDTKSLLTSLGIVGLTVGFAAKDTLSNVISGLFIFWDRPFVIGDLVEIGGNYGKVQDITLRSTRVVTVDGKMLAIPNTTIVNSSVASYTNFPHLRLDIEITVGVDEDLPRVRRIFEELVEDQEGLMSTPPPEMVLTSVNDFNLTLHFRVWLDDEREHIAQRFKLRERLFGALRQEKVDMPYETLQLRPLEVTGTQLASPQA